MCIRDRVAIVPAADRERATQRQAGPDGQALADPQPERDRRRQLLDGDLDRPARQTGAFDQLHLGRALRALRALGETGQHNAPLPLEVLAARRQAGEVAARHVDEKAPSPARMRAARLEGRDQFARDADGLERARKRHREGALHHAGTCLLYTSRCV